MTDTARFDAPTRFGDFGGCFAPETLMQSLFELEEAWRRFTADEGFRAELAAELDVPLLGQLPLVPALREGGDDGRPIAAVEPDSEAARAFAEIARAVAEDLRPKKVFSPELRVI